MARRLVVVAGTGTDVGKTWVLAGLIEVARRRGNTDVAVRKPAQSFAPGEGPTDADVLARAAADEPHAVCPAHRWYEVPMAPFMAADVLGRPPFTMAELITEIEWPAGVDVGFVESAGGVRSPIASDGGDTLDLARALGARQVVLVADAGLGTLNSVRLCLDALHRFDATVFLNRFDLADDLHVRNRDWLATHVNASIYTEVDTLASLFWPPDPGL